MSGSSGGGPARPKVLEAWNAWGQVPTDPDVGRLQGSWEDQPSALDSPTGRSGKGGKAQFVSKYLNVMPEVPAWGVAPSRAVSVPGGMQVQPSRSLSTASSPSLPSALPLKPF